MIDGSFLKLIGSFAVGLVIMAFPILTGISFCLRWDVFIRFPLVMGTFLIYFTLSMTMFEKVGN